MMMAYVYHKTKDINKALLYGLSMDFIGAYVIAQLLI